VRKKPDATVLAFDFGTRRIGVAVANTLTRVAHALTTVDAPNATTHFTAIAGLIDEWQPTQIVVGLPVHADGTPHAMTARARRVARDLGTRFGLPVVLVDERFTSQAAGQALRAAGHGGRAARARRDETAAQVILQAWLDETA
jgi:putative Holliday junction resolvase